MRRSLFSLLAGGAFLVAAPAAEAQTIGFKLGASMSTVSVEDDEGVNIDSRTAFGGGGFIRFGMGRIGIQPELLFLSKGFSADAPGDDDVDLQLDYVEIPVLLHLPLSMGTSFAPYVFGGPAFAFEVGCEAGNDAVTIDCDEDGADLFDRKKTDVGIAAGAGLEFAMGPGSILLEGRYTWGLTNLNESDNESESLKNRSAFFAAGYSIPLGRRY